VTIFKFCDPLMSLEVGKTRHLSCGVQIDIDEYKRDRLLPKWVR